MYTYQIADGESVGCSTLPKPCRNKQLQVFRGILETPGVLPRSRLEPHHPFLHAFDTPLQLLKCVKMTRGHLWPHDQFSKPLRISGHVRDLSGWVSLKSCFMSRLLCHHPHHHSNIVFKLCPTVQAIGWGWTCSFRNFQPTYSCHISQIPFDGDSAPYVFLDHNGLTSINYNLVIIL